MKARMICAVCALATTAFACADKKPPQTPESVTASSTETTSSNAAIGSSDSDMLRQQQLQQSQLDRPARSYDLDDTRSPSSTPPPSSTTSETAVAGDVNKPEPKVDDKKVDDTKADNTKNNQRDRSGTLTPMSQGNSKDETKMTAAIRKGVMAEKSLSFTAKNAKIITVGTKVTLRGVVKTDQEKATIETIARQTDGVTDVDNQLEVKK